MISIITDSACDLPKDLIDKYNIIVLPMNITLGDKTYLDQEELSTETFYAELIKNNQPKTAYPTLGLFKNALEKELAKDNDVIVITLADALSGYYKATLLVSQDYDQNKIAIFDSEAATMSQGAIVLDIAKKVAKGISFQELKAITPSIIKRKQGYGAIKNLEYLKRGGRINSTTAAVATALNIKPVIIINPDGSLGVTHKVRGIQKAIAWLKERIKQDSLDFSNETLFVGYIIERENAELLANKLKEELTLGEVIINQIGPTVGTHLGPGCVSLFYLTPEK